MQVTEVDAGGLMLSGYIAYPMSDRVALARAIAARSASRFVSVPRQRGGHRYVSPQEQIAIKQGRWAEKERERLIHLWND